MKMLKITGIGILAVCLMLTSGCISQEKFDDLKTKNRIQQDRISELESELTTCSLELKQARQMRESLYGKSNADITAKDAEIKALEADIEKKKQLIAKMQAQLLRSGAALPMELSVKLQDFANKTDGVEFDPSTGMLKFESDLLFDLGSDSVASGSADSVKALSTIINSDEAKNFNVIIAGHTDDVPIKKPSTLAKHPTNWHLSAHRAISVLKMMTSSNVDPKRISIQGFGQYVPIEENKAGNKGNPANRRVEIYLVPGN